MPMQCPECGVPVDKVGCVVDPQRLAHRFTAGCGHDLDHDQARQVWEAGLRWYVPPLNGATLIGAERTRHITEEGHDADTDAAHTSGELAWSAWALIDRAAKDADPGYHGPPQIWPLPRERWPGGKSPLRLLIIAGSFIAAEIDRRLAAGEKP